MTPIPAFPPRRPALHRSRSAFTFVELLLVLGVLVLLASITWPALLRNYDDYLLKRSAQDVRIQLAATRTRSIDQGTPYQFLFEPGGRRYASVPHERTTRPSIGPVFASTPVDNLPRESGLLPEGLLFAPLPGVPFLEHQLEIDWFAGLLDAQELAAAVWSPPLLFFGDGSSENAAFQILNPAKGRAVTVYVRGLTGAAETGDVEWGNAP